MNIKKKILLAKPGTDWLTDGLNEVEIKQNRDLGIISAEIEMRRHEMGLNQKQMAELLGVTQGMVSKYESGEYNFTIGTLNEICGKIGLVFEPVIHNPYEVRNQFQIIKNETDIKEPHLYDVDKLGAIA